MKKVKFVEDKNPIYLTEEGFSDTSIGIWDKKSRVAILKKDTEHTIIIQVDKATIDGTNAKLGGKNLLVGIVMAGRTNLLFQNITMTAYRCGVYAEECTQIAFHKCNMKDMCQAFDFAKCDIFELEYVSIANTEEIGIYMQHCTDVTISHVILECCGHFGINMMFSKNFDVIYNEVVDAEYPMLLMNCCAASLQYNAFGKASETGVSCIDSYDVLISENNVVDHEKYGILLEECMDCSVQNNTFDSCRLCAIGAHFSRNVEIVLNVITGSCIGCVIDHFSGARLKKNTIDTCERYGIWIRKESGNALISENRITKCNRGMYLDQINEALVIRNYVDSCVSEGIYVDSEKVTILHNNLIHNGVHIVDVRDGLESQNCYAKTLPIGGNYYSDQEVGTAVTIGEHCVDEWPYSAENGWLL